GDETAKARAVVVDEAVSVAADLVEQSPAGRVITPTQLPGQGSPCHTIVGSPAPNLVFSRPRSATSRRSARCCLLVWSKARAPPRRPHGPTRRPRRGSPRGAWRSCPG